MVALAAIAPVSPRIAIAKNNNGFTTSIKSIIIEFYNKSAMNTKVALFGFYGLRDTMQ